MSLPKCISTLSLKPGGRALLAMVDSVRRVPEGGRLKWTAVAVLPSGRIELIYTETFQNEPDAVRVEMLEHEAHHIACATFSRKGDREPMLWNAATDCAINHHLDRECLPKEGCFYDTVLPNGGVTPMPAEALYELLKEQGGGEGGGCGHTGIDLSKVPIEALPKLVELAGEVAKSIGAQAGSRSGGGGDIVLPPVATYPKWVRELERLLKSKTTIVRRHTWMRENRVIDAPVRGRHRIKRRDVLGGLLLLDASGSMWGELPMLLAIIQKYLPKADGAVWDTVASARGPVPRMLDKTRDVGGGGTSPACAVGLKRTGEITVWVSDGYVDAWPEMTGNDIVVLTTADGQRPQGGTVIYAES